MRLILLLLIINIFQGCHLDKEDGYPDIRYAKGDIWVNNWRNNSFPAKAFVDDKIYCSSAGFSTRDSSELLYCLNLKTGVVDWRTEMKQSAGAPPVVCDSFIYFCNYVGDIFRLDKQGNKIWQQQTNGSYCGHFLNPLNNNLIVHTIEDGTYEFALGDGAVVNHFAPRSLGSSMPVFYKGHMIQAGIRGDSTSAVGRLLRCIDYAARKSIWEYDMGEDVDNLFVNKGRVYFIIKDRRMHCVDIVSGAHVWQSESLKEPGSLGIGYTMAFDQGKIICWEHNLNDFLVLDEDTGGSVVNVSYQEVLNMHLMKPRNYDYAVKVGDKQYTVRVSDSLEGPVREYNVEVIRK
jgi:outer membrane protein assembly factor BamB